MVLRKKALVLVFTKKVLFTSLVQIREYGQDDVGSYLANLILTCIINNNRHHSAILSPASSYVCPSVVAHYTACPKSARPHCCNSVPRIGAYRCKILWDLRTTASQIPLFPYNNSICSLFHNNCLHKTSSTLCIDNHQSVSTSTPQPPKTAAAAENFTAAENRPQNIAAGHNQP